MPHIIGGAVEVVKTDDLSIQELAGNVASSELDDAAKRDRLSIALVKTTAATSEPWLTLHYDEWICVLKGRMILHYGDGETLEVPAGKTVMIEEGERFRPFFDAGTEYVPVCLPAFRPDRCIREEGGEESAVSAKLAQLHAKPPPPPSKDDPTPEVMYHMCEKKLWEEAKQAGTAYYPPTFEVDGSYTHATACPERLVTTFNHFYTEIEGDWVCLQFRRSVLKAHGIVVRDEAAMPVGETAVGGDWGEWVCPHVIGGIHPSVVDAEFPMVREGKECTVIAGVTDVPRRIFKLAVASEVDGFKASGLIASGLDKADEFVHLSDRTSGPVVASLFFKDSTDLQLIEIDANLLPGPINWIVGKMGDAPPDEAARNKGGGAFPTTIHYLIPDGCVHVYSSTLGVPMEAVVRTEAVPLGADGVHQFPHWLATDVPRRVFKLAVASEVDGFKASGLIASGLDKADEFVHLSDRTSGPVVASLFFKESTDLQLIEIDANLLPGPINWIVGKMGDAPPDEAARNKGGGAFPTTIHYLIPDGCVHVYSSTLGVPMEAVVRMEAVPLGADGVHQFPGWL
jgi:uncharacterized protein (DUF952 family)/mannose-6-phosphate isomerase-like protein (cupin superfamily)